MLTHSIDENEDFGPGKLVLPITIGPVDTVCFLPCGGMDPETDELPTWTEKVELTRLMYSFIWRQWLTKLYASFDVKLHRAIWNEGRGKITTKKDTNYVHMFPGQVEEGDYLLVNNEAKKSIHDLRKRQFSGWDGRIGHLHYGLERVSEKALVIQNWEGTLRTWRPQGDSEPISRGQTGCVPESGEISDDNVGTLQISFTSARFNGCGFLVHETHVVEWGTCWVTYTSFDP